MHIYTHTERHYAHRLSIICRKAHKYTGMHTNIAAHIDTPSFAHKNTDRPIQNRLAYINIKIHKITQMHKNIHSQTYKPAYIHAMKRIHLKIHINTNT